VSELGEVLASAGDRAMAVCAVTGVGGVGKTALAVRVARQARNAFPDGQLFADLQGAGPRAARPETVLGSFLRALGAADSALPDSLEERSALYRSVLDGRRVLVVLDNAKDAAQVRPLLPGMEGCAALVTSRTRMADLPGAHLVDLDVMAPDEALTLFTRIVGEDRVAGEREAALEVMAACGFLPLAVRIAASRLASRRTWTVSALAARLADERDRLDQLGVGELAVTDAFDRSYRALEPAQARAFRLLGVPDGPDVSLPAAAAVLDRPVARTEDLLESLVDTSLLESVAPGRYRYHDLVRLYARACAERDERPPTEIKAARTRLLDFHLDTAVGVYAGERPGDRLVDHLEPTRGGGLHFTGRAQGLDWLFGEAGALLAAAHQAATAGQVRKGVDLLLLTRDLAGSGRHVQRYESVAGALLDAAVAAGDTRAEARARAVRARLHCLAGRFADAEPEAGEAVRLAASAGDTWTMADGLTVKGLAALERNRHQDAEQDLARAVECFRGLGDRPGEARALSRLSRVHLATGATPAAVVLARRAVALHDATGASGRGGHARHALALALARSGEPDSAARRLHEAVERFRAGRQLLSEAQALCGLAEISLDVGRPAEAAAHAERALSVLRGVEAEWHRANALTVLGRALARLGRRDAADVAWRDAVHLYTRLRSPEAETVRALLDGTYRDRCGVEA
jgi:tetratricopeptide (TPR) repeat protein